MNLVHPDLTFSSNKFMIMRSTLWLEITISILGLDAAQTTRNHKVY